MASASKDPKFCPGQLLCPLALVAFVLALQMAFQTTQILRDRETLHMAKTQQDKPLEDSQKLQAQFSSLAMGTKKLADEGNKDAQLIVDRLKQNGISFGSPNPATIAAPHGAPAASPTPGSGGTALPAPAAPPATADQP